MGGTGKRNMFYRSKLFRKKKSRYSPFKTLLVIILQNDCLWHFVTSPEVRLLNFLKNGYCSDLKENAPQRDWYY